MERIDGTSSGFCATGAPVPQCFCSEKERFFNMIYNKTHADYKSTKRFLDVYDKKPLETFVHVWHILWTIVPVVFFFAVARIVCQKFENKVQPNPFCKFGIEFILIVVPTVLFVNVLNNYVCYVMILFGVSLLASLYLVYSTKAQNRWYILGGGRPFVLTLDRATINLLTALCILAVDFASFPKHFRKTRRYGVGLMDVGIGLFVFAMGTVSRSPRNIAHLRQILWTVVPLLMLGLIRTVVIRLIHYEQDDHEYGLHLNAFFTLGLTKFFGSVVSGLAKYPLGPVIAGVALLSLHEYGLQLGISSFVMDSAVNRDTLLSANREGICSLPGFTALYLLSIFIGQCLRMKDGVLSYKVFISKLKAVGIVSAGLWLLVVGCIFTVSIARVTCNFGYVAWILAIALTMTFLFMIVFHLILNTLWPICDRKILNETNDVEAFSNSTAIANCSGNVVPVIVEAVNKNGLVFFLLANVLTGAVNMYLEPSDRSNLEGIFILTIYMFIAIGFVYILHRLKVRIA